MERRDFMAMGLALGAASMVSGRSLAAGLHNLPNPILDPPLDDRTKFVEWMVVNRGEDRAFLRERYDRCQKMIRNGDLAHAKEVRAFLLTPREDFVLAPNLPRAYANAFLDIGFGVTISGPHLVGRMTSALNVRSGDRVLEVGTGSGYQSALLSHLTGDVHTIEIIRPLQRRTRAIYDRLIAHGYPEYRSIGTENADGYYGWKDHAPFDKIIVTCGIDHVPPALLRQLRPDGIMVIPIGPPGAQHVLRIVKRKLADGRFAVSRSDIYNGRIVNFVPFTKLDHGKIVGTHSA